MTLARAARIALVNLLVFLVLVEAAGAVVYYWQHGWLFYVAPYRRDYAVAEDIQRDALTASGLHPYFGQTHRPGIRFDIPPALRRPGVETILHTTNNYGFVSAQNYPIPRRSPDQFFIGILGGSVANWFCEVGATRLLADLKAHPNFARRDIVPVCLSHEGYKQPQQLLVISYFLSIGQPLDLVINISGFNEVALGSLNQERGWDVSMPSVMHLDPLMAVINQTLLTPEKLESLSAIRRDRERLIDLAARINRTPFASVYVALEASYRAVDERYRAEQLRFQNLPAAPGENTVVHVTPATTARDARQAAQDSASQWAASSVLIHDLLKGRGIAYVDVLQPNQYHATRTLPPAEAAIALSDASPFKTGATLGYPFLEQAVTATNKARPDVKLLNGARIFDRADVPVYMDNCCHYTLAGNDLLADFLAGQILASVANP